MPVAVAAVGCAALACSAGDQAPGGNANGLPRLEPVATFGCAECEGPEQLAFAFLTVGPSGRVYVSDRYAPHLRVLELDGRVALTIGDDGQGPGEIRMGQAMLGALETSDGGFWVQEVMQFHRFDADGGFVGSEPYRVRLPIGIAYDHAREQVYFYGFPGPMMEGAGTGQASVFRWTIGTEEPEIVLGPEELPRSADDPERSSRDVAIAVAPDGRLVVADGWEYSLRFYGADGALRQEAGRDLERPLKSDTELDAELERARQTAERLGSTIRKPRPDKSHIAAFGLAFDGAGRLWALTTRGDGLLDVFAPDGAYLGEVDLGVSIVPLAPAFAIGGDVLAATVRDDEGIDRVRIWSIRAP